MNRTLSFGLIGRIVMALSTVFALLILLNDLTVSSVLHMWLQQSDGPSRTDIAFSHLRKPILIYSITAAAVSLLVASVAIHRIVVRPIRHITRALDDVAHGNPNVRVNVGGATELILMGANFNRMIETIQHQKNNLETQLATLAETSQHLKNTQDDLIRSARLASVGTLASGVAHEIGNPIAGILGLLDALDGESDSETARSYRALIRKEIERIDKTIRDLLNYARPTRSNRPPQASLSGVLAHVKRLVEMQKNFSHIALEYQLPPALVASSEDTANAPLLLAIPEDDLTAVFVNLFLNAAQAISGKGLIRVYCKLHENEKTVAIHVVDNGPGIDIAVADRIFDPFFTNRTAGGGTGLGLAICMSLCERNHSRIELLHPADPGAHFRLIIPLSKPSPSTNVNLL